MLNWLQKIVQLFSKPQVIERKPKTLTEAVDMIVSNLDEESISFIKAGNDPAVVHHGFGRHIRNTWGLWHKDSPLSHWFQIHLYISHGDDLSGIIMGMVWAKVRNEFFDPFAEAERYHKHWIGLGVDPLTQERRVLDVDTKCKLN